MHTHKLEHKDAQYKKNGMCDNSVEYHSDNMASDNVVI